MLGIGGCDGWCGCGVYLVGGGVVWIWCDLSDGVDFEVVSVKVGFWIVVGCLVYLGGSVDFCICWWGDCKG